LDFGVGPRHIVMDQIYRLLADCIGKCRGIEALLAYCIGQLLIGLRRRRIWIYAPCGRYKTYDEAAADAAARRRFFVSVEAVSKHTLGLDDYIN